MADRWDVRAAGPRSAPDHGGRAFARRGLAVALPALLAFASVRCFQDLLVEPSQPAYAFSITPDSADVAIGDTVAPYRGTLTADGQPIGFRLGLAVTAGQDVIRVDSLGRIVPLQRGVARLTVRPLISAFTSDTLQRHVTLRAVVLRLGVVSSPSVDTLTSLGDTLDLHVAALTRAGDTIPGVPIVWRRVSGDTAVTLLDSATGRVRAARNGEAEFVAIVDTASARRRVLVRQAVASFVMPDSLVLVALGQTAALSGFVQDRRGNRVAGASVAWSSLDPGVATITSSGVVAALANGVARIEGRVGNLADTMRVVVRQQPRGLRRVSGDGQSGRVGDVLPAAHVVQIVDSLGIDVAQAGVGVRFGVTVGGGKIGGLDSAQVLTDAGGHAAATLTLSTVAGVHAVTARLVGWPASEVTFTATATPGTATSLSRVSGDRQTGVVRRSLAQPFVVAVRDTFGNGVGGRSVLFRVTSGGGRFDGVDSAVVTTSEVGLASVTLALGTVVGDTNRVTATSPGAPWPPVTFAAVPTIGEPHMLVAISGDGQTAVVATDLSDPFVVAVRDSFGTGVPGQAVVFRVMRGGGKLAGNDTVAVTTDGTGTARARVTLGTVADTNLVTVFPSGFNASPVTFSAVATSGPATVMTTVSGDGQVGRIGAALAAPFVVVVRDAYGNGVSGHTVDFHVSAGRGTFGLGSADTLRTVATGAAGAASATLTLGQGLRDGDTVAATASTRTLSQSVTFKSVATEGALVSGLIGANTTWTASENPYRLVGNAVVGSGVTLTIQPGVRVLAEGNFFLRVDGNLVARGQSDSLIVFTSRRASPAPGDWVGIDFPGQGGGEYRDTSVIDFALIEYAGNGLFLEGGPRVLVVRHSTIRLNSVGIVQDYAYLVAHSNAIVDNSGCAVTIWHGAQTLVEDNILSGNGCGVLSRWGEFTLQYNNIVGNRGAALINDGSYGFTLTDNKRFNNIVDNVSGVCVPVRLRLTRNNLIANGPYDYSSFVDCASVFGLRDTVDVSGNWWGTTDVAVTEVRIKDFFDDPNFMAARAQYLPMASAPVPDAGARGLGSVSIAPSNVSLVLTQTAQLNAIVLDGSGTPQAGATVRWVTSSDGVASVSPSGLVAAVAIGTATIAAISGGRIGMVVVTVN